MTNITKANTFENKYEVAKVGFRILAFLIDFTFFFMLVYVMGIFFGEPSDSGGVHLSGFPAFVMFLVSFILWPVSEAIFGQTIGKRVFNLEVVRENYKPIGMGQAFGRFFLGLIDYFFLIGIIVSTTNSKNQRIGDLVTKTIVIKRQTKAKF